MYSSLSSYESIKNNAKFSDSGYSTVKTLGSFINNSEYSKSFLEFVNNRNTADAYTWKCLSAIGEEIGEITYTNIRNYVDFVSNVDICKVQSLRSMMKMLGFDYTVFDDIEMLPVEVLDLLNVMSISRKYLLDNKTLQQGLLDDLSAAGVLKGRAETDLSAVSAYYGDDAVSCSVDGRYIDEEKYFEYIKNLYKALLSGFMYLEYNVLSAGEESPSRRRYYVYPSIAGDFIANTQQLDSGFDYDIREFKLQHSIPLDFDQSGEADKIDEMLSSLSDYQYPYSDLMQIEIDRRAAKVLSSDISGYSQADYARLMMNKSRYSYYRRQKVLDYANFINSKYFVENIIRLSSQIYAFDPNYMDLMAAAQNSEWNVVSSDGNGNYAIREDMIDTVAVSLAIATQYIVKLRQKLKLQCRKYYMKGTQNLLLYVINEYLIDYSRHRLRAATSADADGGYVIGLPDSIKYVLAQLSSHQHANLDVIEYYDETEYYNQNTETTVSARNRLLTNDDFWKEYDLTADNGVSYGLEEIQKFYLSAMAMKDVLSDVDDLSAFLDTVFSVGADTSFVDKTTGVFSAKLQNGRYSSDIYPTLSALSVSDANFRAYLDTGYSYPAGVAYDQLSDAETCIFKSLSSRYFADISSVYDKYVSRLESLSSQYDDAAAQYAGIVSGEYMMYFTSSDSEFCQRETEEGLTEYAHDFYIGNPAYERGADNLGQKLANFKNFIESYGIDTSYYGYNIVNHRMMDTLSALSSSIATISSQYETNVVKQITDVIGDSGFVDIQSPDLDAELQYGYDYLTQRKSSRLAYLNSVLDEIRSQAATLQSDYNALETTFANIVAQYDDNNTYYQLGQTNILAFSVTASSSEKTGWTWDSTPPTNNKYVNTIYVPELKRYYYYKEDGNGKYEYMTTSVTAYNGDDSLPQRINELIEYMQAPTSFNGGVLSYGLMQEGTYASAKSCQTQYNDLVTRVSTIAARLRTIGDDYDASIYSNLELKDQIEKLVDHVTGFDESTFESDTILGTAKALLAKVVQLSAQFTSAKTSYSELLNDSQQADFLADFTQGDALTQAEISRMAKYTVKKDAESKSDLLFQYEEMYQEFTTAQEFCNMLTSDMAGDMDNVTGTTGVLETDIESVNQDLLRSIDDRFEIQNLSCEAEKAIVEYYAATMSSNVSDEMSSLNDFGQIVSARISALNFFDDEWYNTKKKVFQTYTGISGESLYPYYSRANETHPSYQVHPFLWNFVVSEKYNMNAITKSFNSIAVEQLEDTQIQTYISRYFAEFGNQTSAWLWNALDYSGYMTRYEQSQHYSSHTQAKSEVVDYDGAFYPPALEYMKRDYRRSLNSVSACMQLASLGSSSGVKSVLSGALSGYIEYSDIYDDYGQSIGIRCDDYSAIVQNLSTLVDMYYGTSGRLSALVGEYVQDCTTSAGILSAFTTAGLAEKLQAGFEETFYGRYFKQLGLEKGSTAHQFAAAQIEEYFPEISALTRTTRDASNIYDIYKYASDGNGNQYFIYKLYGESDATFKEKRDTAGRLWIRLAEHPFAFPAFTGTHPNVKMDEYSLIHPSIASLAGVDSESAKPISVADEMRYFYDMYMQQDNAYLYLVSYIKDGTFKETSPFVQNFENPWIVILPLGRQDASTRQMVFRLGADNASKYDNALKSGWNYYGNPRLSCVPETSSYIDSYAFVGAFSDSASETRFIYAMKRSYGDLTRDLLDGIRIIPVKSGLIRQQRVVNFDLSPTRPFASDDIVAAYDQSGVTTIAYLVENVFGRVENESFGSSTDLSANTAGTIFGDPRPLEMTSHDVFAQDVEFEKFKFIGNNSIQRVANSGTQHNMNADMSYIPVYPGLSGEARLCSIADDYIRVQLLGASKDISRYDAASNVSVDPYFDFGRISDDYVFGRAYEDYDSRYDRALLHFQNPSVNSRSAGSTPDFMSWKISLSAGGYSRHDVETTMVALYSAYTLGKNQYYVGPLSAFADGGWLELSGYEKSRDLSDFAEIVLSGLRDMTETRYVNVAGTYDGGSEENAADCNHIDNVSGMSARYDQATQAFEIGFGVADQSLSADTFVRSGMMRAVFYNQADMRLFNYYHYMDVYGAVNAHDGTVDMPTDIHGRHFDFIFDTAAYERKNIISALRSYYLKENGRKQYTDQIDLSAYDFLSDVYILQTHRRFNFMYDEELRDDFYGHNYYFPSFNTKYPMNSAQGFRKYQSESGMDDLTLKNLFDENNLFILDLLEAREIADDIGTAEVPLQKDETECYRVFEQYTELSTLDGRFQVSGVYGKYDPADSRSFQYIHGLEGGYGAASENSAEICAIITDNPETETACRLMSSLSCYAKSSQDTSNANIKEKIRFSVSSANIDAKKLLRLYVNYRRTDDGIYLYFNYFNRLNTPYVEIRDNLVYPAVLSETYLKLAPGENGSISFVMQLKYVKNGDIVGCRNVTLAKYAVYNMSDDKPKFMLKLLQTVEDGDATENAGASEVAVTVNDITVQTSAYQPASYPDFDIYVDIASVGNIKAGYKIGIDYQPDVMRFTRAPETDGIEIDASCQDAGYLEIKVADPNLTYFKLGMTSAGNAAEMAAYKGKYPVYVTVPDGIVSENGLTAKIQTQDGFLEIA